MDKKAYYQAIAKRALKKKADAISEFRRLEGAGSIKVSFDGDRSFSVNYGHVKIGVFFIPTLFLKFVRDFRNSLLDNTGNPILKYPADQAYKYVLDGVLEPKSPQSLEALRQLMLNIQKIDAGSFQKGEEVHHEDFQEAKIDVDAINKYNPIAAKYLSVKQKLLTQMQQAQKTTPGMAKAQSRIIRKKIIAKAKKNRRDRNA